MRALLFSVAVLLIGTLGGSAIGAPDDAPLPIASLTDGVWMKGDLHVHSRHSQDSSNNPIAKIIALAETVHMDYLLVSDHDNHVGGDVAHHTWADPDYKSGSVVLLYGAEWTTHRGHGTAISDKPYDHQKLYDVRDQRDVKILAVKKALGIHLSANHPAGGKNNYSISYDTVDSIEVWNSAAWPKNASSMKVWDDLLKSGRKLTGRGGSDSHHGKPDTPDQATALSIQAPMNNVGTPTTWVFASARTGAAVVAGLTGGRVSISANPYAPRVEFYADLDQDGRMDMMMGDNAKATGKPVAFRVLLTGNVVAAATYTVKVVKDGEVFGTYQMNGAKPSIDFTDIPASAARSYYRVEVEGPQTAYPEVPGSSALSEKMVGLSNPIFFNFDPDF